MANLSQFKFDSVNLEFALIEGLDNNRRGRGLRRKGHKLLFPMPLLIQGSNQLLFKCLNGLTSPMSDKIIQWRFARPLGDWG